MTSFVDVVVKAVFVFVGMADWARRTVEATQRSSWRIQMIDVTAVVIV